MRFSKNSNFFGEESAAWEAGAKRRMIVVISKNRVVIMLLLYSHARTDFGGIVLYYVHKSEQFCQMETRSGSEGKRL